MLKTILIVEDSASDRLFIKRILKEYTILVACDGVEAMQQLEEHGNIDLVILDLNMPNMDGFEVLEAMNADERYKKVRTIILTNYDELDNEIRGLKLGAVDYIRKPVQMDSLKARIDVHAKLLLIQHLYEQKIYEQDLTFDTIFYQAPIGIAISHNNEDEGGSCTGITKINPMYEEITGRTSEELLKLGWAKITHPDDVAEDVNNFNKLRSGEIKSYSMDKRFIKPDGSIVWVNITVTRLILMNNENYSHICLVQDINKRREAEIALLESERSKSVLLSHLPGLAYRCDYDRDWTMQYVSAGCLALTGYQPESLLHNRDLSYNDLITPEYRDILWQECERMLAEKLPFKQEYEITTAIGEKKWVLEMGEGIFDEQGTVIALEGIIIDISEQKKYQNLLVYNSEHNRLTGLLNLNSLENLLTSDNLQGSTNKRALMVINMSASQALTKVYGFHYTQALLKKMADLLSACCSDKHLLFHTSIDQFVFYLKDYKDTNELYEFCKSFENILEPLLRTDRINGAVGIIEVEPGNRLDADSLLKKILIASEKAIDVADKHFGICFYDDAMETQIMREEEIKCELARIADDENNKEIFLLFQPIFDLKANKICAFEALARLNSKKFGMVSPLEFIPIAEKTKLIIPLGRRIIKESLDFLAKLQSSGFSLISISINISTIQLMQTDFVDNLLKTIKELQVSPDKIGLELTESVFSSNYEEINGILGKLRETGIHIAIDDFGTGYSSFARERELKVDCLKIDKYFIDKLMEIEAENALTSDIVSMAHKMGHCVIAEGVEYEKQKQYLESFDCDKIQGYLISRPLDAQTAIELLNK